MTPTNARIMSVTLAPVIIAQATIVAQRLHISRSEFVENAIRKEIIRLRKRIQRDNQSSN